MDRRSTPSQLLANRQGCKSSQSWRETYKERCRQRLKQRRFDHLFRRQLDSELKPPGGFPWEKTKDDEVTNRSETRRIVHEVMTCEWQAMRQELQDQVAEGSDLTPDNMPMFIDLMEELDEELRLEETAILDKYDERRRMDEDDLCSALQSLCTNELLCPLCKINPLFQNKSVVFCACGLRIDTEQDALTLGYVRKQLQEGTDQHGLQCDNEPSFSVNNVPEIHLANLLLHCHACDFLFVVL